MKIKGYACHFGKPNKNGEIVFAKSFAETLRAFSAGEMIIPINVDHTDEIVGKVLSMQADKTGLLVECEILDTLQAVHDKIRPLITGEVFCHFSTEGYVPSSAIKEVGKGVYECEVFDLRAVAIVTAPADGEATFIVTQNKQRPNTGVAVKQEEPHPNMSIYDLLF